MSRLKERVKSLEQRAPALPIKIVWQAQDGTPGFYHNSDAIGDPISDDELERLELSTTLIKVCYNEKAERITKEDDDELSNKRW